MSWIIYAMKKHYLNARVSLNANCPTVRKATSQSKLKIQILAAQCASEFPCNQAQIESFNVCSGFGPGRVAVVGLPG
jgi:hypothetical protein